MRKNVDWKILDFYDLKTLRERLDDTSLMGSDSSLINLFLLQKKYNIQICMTEHFLFRKYTGKENRTGYAFPLSMRGFCGDLKEAVGAILKDSEEHGTEARFCLLTETQKNDITSCLAQHFPLLHAEWSTNRDDSDYIYDRELLATLPGKNYHKKKNHVSRFCRIYEGQWEFRSLSLCHIEEDIVSVAESWLREREEQDDDVLRLELESIKLAVEKKDLFKVEGGVLYVHGKPCAMTLASRISDKTMDVHFEKCLSHAAANGAYAAVNWCFASSCPDFEYFNREEDMGVEGLRKAKISYRPQIILDKYYGRICGGKTKETENA